MYGMRAQDNAPATHFRSDRMCRVNGELYFCTRENTLEGPYANAEVAAREIQAYIERMQKLSADSSNAAKPSSEGHPQIPTKTAIKPAETAEPSAPPQTTR